MKLALVTTGPGAPSGIGDYTRALARELATRCELEVYLPDSDLDPSTGGTPVRRLTQAEAAKLLNVDQPKISALKCGRLAGFSLDRLVRFLVLLGNDVDIVVKDRPRSRRPARLMIA